MGPFLSLYISLSEKTGSYVNKFLSDALTRRDNRLNSSDSLASLRALDAVASLDRILL